MTMQEQMKRFNEIAQEVQTKRAQRDSEFRQSQRIEESFKATWNYANQGVIRSTYDVFQSNLTGMQLQGETVERRIVHGKGLNYLEFQIGDPKGFDGQPELVKFRLEADPDKRTVKAVYERVDGTEVVCDTLHDINTLNQAWIFRCLNDALEFGGYGAPR